MLREQVLQEWNSYKEKVISFKKANFTKQDRQDLEFIVDKITFSNFIPKIYSSEPFEKTRQQLEFWNSAEYYNKYLVERQEVDSREFNEENEILSYLLMVYYDYSNLFRQLVRGWKKEIDDNHSRPTIQEVD